MNERTFTATVEDDERGRVRIRLPFDPDAAWGAKRIHHVGGTVAGSRIRGAVESDEGGWVLVLTPSWHREAPEIVVGGEVGVTLRPEGPQRADLAPDIAAALEADPAAGDFFDGLAQFYRKGYLTWIDATKRSPEKRAERIAEVVHLLAAGMKQRP